MYPAFSPDGSKIAFCAAAAGDDSGLWIAGSDGKNPKAVAVGPGLKQHTSWSRGGWDVYYSAWYEPGPALFDSSLITGRTTIVAQLPHDASGPMLSPDGAAVAFNRTIDGVTTVWIDAVGSVGGGSRRLTSNADLARFPVWSPLGKLIAVQVRRPDGSAVGVIPPRGGKLRIITTEPGESWPYGWSPDEKQIAFAGRRDGVWNIWIVPVDGGTPRRLTMNESTTTWMRSPAWSPLGAQIVYESGTPKANLWVSEAVGKP
jgi:TolB protein